MLLERKIERMMSKVEQDPNGGCWLWNGILSRGGYGIFYNRGGSLAHRTSYQMFRGDPGKSHVLHKCDVRCCVNPDHLFLGTNADNVADKVAKGRARGGGRKGSKHHASKMNEQAVVEVRAACVNGATQQSQAGKFGVSQSVINEIVNGKAWKHVQ